MASLASLLYDLRRIEAHREVLTEKKIQKIYSSLRKDLNAMLSDEYIEHADPNGALFYGSVEDKIREARFLEEISGRVSSITPELQAEIDDLCEKVYTDCYKGLYKAVITAEDGAEAAAALSTIKANPRIIKRMYENGITKLTLPPLLERQRADIVYQIKQELTIGMINGDRQDVVAKKISERLDFSMKKSNNIVRTETHRNIETGMYDSAVFVNEGLEGSDLVLVKIWRTMKDERVRPQQRRKTKKGWKTTLSKNGANHMKMEGVAVLADEDFQLEGNVKAKCPSQSGVARHDCNCRCFVEYKLMKRSEYEKLTAKNTVKNVAKITESGIINKTDLSKYIGQPITATDNQHIREWYYANASAIPDLIDKSLPIEEQARQAFDLRNKIKNEAREAMGDKETAEALKKKRPILSFDELVESKMKRKGMTRDEAIADIMKTASKTNADINKEFGL